MLVSAIAFPQPDQRPIMAVLNFETSGVSEAEMRLLVDYLSAQIVKSGRFRVIDRSQRQAFLSEIEFSQSDCSGDVCLLQIGRLLSANQIVAGSLGSFGQKFVLSIKLIDVQTGETIAASSDVYSSLDELLADSPRLAVGLVETGRRAEALSDGRPKAVHAPVDQSTAEDRQPVADSTSASRQFEIPSVVIEFDGGMADWMAVQPLVEDETGDDLPHASGSGTDMRAVYVGRDARYFYVCFQLSDRLPDARTPSTIIADYNLDFSDPSTNEVARIKTRFDSNRWQAQLTQWNVSEKKFTVVVDGAVKAGEHSFEARFRLSTIVNRMPSAETLGVRANIGYGDRPPWTSGKTWATVDWSETAWVKWPPN